MKRRLKVALTGFVISMITVFAMMQINAEWENVTIVIDGQTYLEDVPLVDGGTTYIPVEMFSAYMNSETTFAYEGQTLTVVSEGLTLEVTDGLNYIIANGRYLYNDAPCIVQSNMTYVPLRSIAKAYSAEVMWDSLEKTVSVNGGGAPIVSGDEFYVSDELYWLSRIINAESGSEPLLGKIAVGNVILNRLGSESYPDTIYDVIFDKRYGVQFTPTINGAINKTPNADSEIAAKICLEGYVHSDEILFFIRSTASSNTWIAKHCSFEETIGNHSFYS